MVFKSHNPKLFGYYVFNAYFQDFMVGKRSNWEFCRPIWLKSLNPFLALPKTLIKFSYWSNLTVTPDLVKTKLYLRLNISKSWYLPQDGDRSKILFQNKVFTAKLWPSPQEDVCKYVLVFNLNSFHKSWNFNIKPYWKSNFTVFVIFE